MVETLRVNLEKVSRNSFTLNCFYSHQGGFACSVGYILKGTMVCFEGASFVTDENHWFDMDVDDFADIFEIAVTPELEDWFQNIWLTQAMVSLKFTHNPHSNSETITTPIRKGFNHV